MQEKNTLANIKVHEYHSEPIVTPVMNGYVVLRSGQGKGKNSNKVCFAPRGVQLIRKGGSSNTRDSVTLTLTSVIPVDHDHEGLYHDLTYEVELSRRGVLGSFQINSIDLNLGEQYDLDTCHALLRDDPKIANSLITSLAAHGYFDLMVGRFLIAPQPRHKGEGQTRDNFINTAEILYHSAPGAVTTDRILISSGSDNRSRFKSNFGPEIRIQTIKTHPLADNPAIPMLEVIWTTPSFLTRMSGKAKGTSFIIHGRHTFQQKLESFLGLYDGQGYSQDHALQKNMIFPGIRAVCEYYGNHGMSEESKTTDFGYADR